MKLIKPSETYQTQITDYFPDRPDLVADALRQPSCAVSPSDPNTVIPYVRLNEGASRPVLYVPGFGENIVNKLPFALALASAGRDVILAGQSSRGLRRTYSDETAVLRHQADSSLAVLEHTRAIHEFDLVTHSLGSLTVESLVSRARTNYGVDTSNAKVAMLAPAGVGTENSYGNLFKRWIHMLKSEWGPDGKDFPDTTGETGRSSLQEIATRPWQSAMELRALRHDQISFTKLCSAVSKVALFCYAEDKMFPQAHIETGLPRALDAGAIALSPVAFTQHSPAERLPGAVHDDEQLNPWRVVHPLAQFLSE